MKKKQAIILCFILSVFPFWAQTNDNVFQGTVTIKGKILDADVSPIPGASILIKGTTLGTATDIEGDYTLANVPVGSTLQFSSIGYVTQEIIVDADKTTINVQLLEDTQQLDEVTIVAFGTQKKESVIASITTISPKQLKGPTSNLTTTFAGQMAGMISYQTSGEPGADNADFFVRGVTSFGYNADPLILVDNIEVDKTELARVQADDIESFSIMKDAAATALYGARGANGVILIKTKEGTKGKATLTLRVENTISQPTKTIKLADPITYMKMHNEAIITRNKEFPTFYSDQKIENTVPGSGSLVFPTTDWMDELMKNYTMNQRVNLNIKGGGDVARYFVSASFSQDNGIMKVDKNNNFNSNIDLKVYTLRSNVNIDVTKTTELKVSLNGTFEDYTGPIGPTGQTGGTWMYNLIMRSNPVLFPAKYPVDEEHQYVQHTLFGNAEDGQYLNPYAEMVKGYREYGKAQIAAQLELNQKLDFITDGLSFRGLFNTTRKSMYEMSRSYRPYYYKLMDYNYLTEEYKIENINPDTGTEYLALSVGLPEVIYTTYMEASLAYNRTFAEIHNFSGVLVMTLQNQNVPLTDISTASDGDVLSSLPRRNFGLAGRLSYGYDSRYLAELNFGYNGSERFSEKQRFGFFPSISAGWVISNEKFFEPVKGTITNLKLRASYGLAGNDKISGDNERFLYMSIVDMNSTSKASGFGFEENAYRRNGISVSRYADPEITWEISVKANYGVEFSLFKDLSVVAEYYTENRKKILQQRASVPYSMGLWANPRANLGKAKGHGVDLSADYSKTIGDFWIQGRFNFTFARSEYTVYEDYDYRQEWWKLRTGNPVRQQYGYLAEGLFIDEEEVKNSPVQTFGEYKAGDLKYRDLNGDGQITDRDMAPIGYPTVPEIQYGFGASMGYKGWDFSFFFNGLARKSFWMNYIQLSPFLDTAPSSQIGHNALAQFIADSYWSEENRNPYAVWPRLGETSTQLANNNQTNTWFMRNGAFLRLKSVELGYTLPENITERIRMKSLRIYVTGGNLFTITKFKLWDTEMGGNGLGYPIQRTFNMGLSLTF